MGKFRFGEVGEIYSRGTVGNLELGNWRKFRVRGLGPMPQSLSVLMLVQAVVGDIVVNNY